jgi:hypothetical protein
MVATCNFKRRGPLVGIYPCLPSHEHYGGNVPQGGPVCFLLILHELIHFLRKGSRKKGG